MSLNGSSAAPAGDGREYFPLEGDRRSRTTSPAPAVVDRAVHDRWPVVGEGSW
jgi:hypothetical protein